MSQKLPFFSSKIPTFDRPVQLTNCLQSLAGLDYPHLGFEVIVVDDGGETLTETVVSSFYDRLNVTFITIMRIQTRHNFLHPRTQRYQKKAYAK
ncbi:MAG: glycosyltransferase [bacterium]